MAPAMTCVRNTYDRQGKWLRWEWDTHGLSMPLACGYSAILMGNGLEENYAIAVEEGTSVAAGTSAGAGTGE